jgi:hypothetical protein
MADEPGINRISLRVPSELFRLIDDKRHAERTSFQQIGIALFRDWLAGVRTASEPEPSAADMTADEAELVQRMLAVIRSGNRDAIDGVTAAIRIGELLISALGPGRGKR